MNKGMDEHQVGTSMHGQLRWGLVLEIVENPYIGLCSGSCHRAPNPLEFCG